MKGNKEIKLSGKCTIQVDTGQGTSKIEIPKKNKKTGLNNVDEFINQAFHLAIMRHGTEGALLMLQEKIKKYD